jgi:MYXO-CTERM domain-containing protein
VLSEQCRFSWRGLAFIFVATSLSLLVAAGCSSPVPPEQVGQSSSAIDTICGEAPSATLDGFPAYAFCGNFDVYSDNGIDTQSTGGAGWVETQELYGYQCTEFALRYFRFKWSVDPEGFVGDAKNYCAAHPAGVTETTSPIHGDLAVFTPGCGGADPTTGHVAVIDTVATSTILVVQQNTAGSFTWPRSCVACYLHAAENGGTADPCSTAPSDGYYCGQSTQWAGATANVLYDCQGGVTQSATPCADGCVVEPAGTNDQCSLVAPDAGSMEKDAAESAADAGCVCSSAGVCRGGCGSPDPPDAGETRAPPERFRPEAPTTSSSWGGGCEVGGGSGSPTWMGLSVAALALMHRRKARAPDASRRHVRTLRRMGRR